MSTETRSLADLAQKLIEFGWTVTSDRELQLSAERDVEDGLTHRLVVRDDPASLVGPLVTGYERLVHQGEEVYHLGVEIPSETLTALALISAWQHADPRRAEAGETEKWEVSPTLNRADAEWLIRFIDKLMPDLVGSVGVGCRVRAVLEAALSVEKQP